MKKASAGGHGDARPSRSRASTDAHALTDIDFENVLKLIQQPIFIADPSDRIVFANAFCLELWQSDPSELADNPTLTEFLTSLFLTGRFPPVNGVSTEAQFRIYLEEYLAMFRAEDFAFADIKVRGKIYRITRSWCGPHRVFSHFDMTEQAQARREADAARKMEDAERKRLSQIFEALPHSAVFLDRNLSIVHWNQKFLEMTDLTPDDLAEFPDFDTLMIDGWRRGLYMQQFAPDQEDTLRRMLAQRSKALLSEQQSMTTVRHDPTGVGADKVFLARSAPIDGGVMLTHVDITAVEAAREQAEAERNRMSQIFEALPHSAVLFDQDLRVVLYNSRFLDLMHLRPEDVIEEPNFNELAIRSWRRGGYSQEFAPDQEAELRLALAKRQETVLSRQGPRKTTFTNPSDRTQQMAFLVEAVPIDAGYMVTHVDVTSLEAAREEAETQRNHLTQVFEALPHSAVLIDRDFSIIEYNRRFLDFMELSREDLADTQDFNEIMIMAWRRGYYLTQFAPDQEAEMRAELASRRQAVLSGQRSRKATKTDPTGNGAEQVYLVESVPIDDGVMLTHVDVTQLEAARVKAEAADKAKSAFLANMSHEIRTPMNGIVGMCEILSGTEMTEEQRLCTRTISDSSMALLNIINDILDFSKIEADKLTLHAEPFSLYDVVYDVASLLAGDASRKGLEICVDYDHSAPTGFLGDAGRIRQVLVNIAGNAIKFTQSGYVLIRVQHDAARHTVEIAVQDTGAGIPEEKLGRIFSAFEQVDNESTRAFEGTGLGLAITDRLVRVMEGDIDVASTQGKGSTFTVKLPLPIAGEVAAHPTSRSRLDGLSVLVVDDLIVNRTILDKKLSRLGAKVFLAESAAAARTLLSEGTRIDLGVFDFHMPQENGADLMRSILTRGDLPPFPTILLSSMDQSWNKAEMSRLGFSDVLVKPARADMLINSISRALHTPDAGADAARPESAVTEQIVDLTGYAILVAEDNRTNQLVISKMLEPTQAELIFCPDGRQTVDSFAERRPDLVLMDISMPVLNGLEATREIRAIETTHSQPRCPIVALTANAMQQHVDEAMAAGMDAFLSKPLRKRDLLATLEQWLHTDDTLQKCD